MGGTLSGHCRDHGAGEEGGGSARFLRNGRSGKVALLVRTRSRLTDDGLSICCYALHRPGGRSVITDPDLAESHWDDLSAESFARLWQAECADLEARPQTERFFLATGRLLPIWNLLGDEAQVRRLVTQDGRSLLGRIVPAETVNALLDKLGLGGVVQLTTREIVQAALSGKVVPIDARQGLSLRRSRVNGEPSRDPRLRGPGAPRLQGERVLHRDHPVPHASLPARQRCRPHCREIAA
jgi:hypothetical protein